MLNKIFTCFLVVFLIGSVSASVSWSIAPSSVNQNENFLIQISGDGMYGLEIEMPEGVIIVSDKSKGVLGEDRIYRTAYATSLQIYLRSQQAGKLIFKGEYSEGEGIKSLPDKIINVIGKEIEGSCVACQDDSEWSDCIEGKELKTIYSCSEASDFLCVQSEKTQDCETEEVETGFFSKIGNLIKRFFDFITFWN